MLKLVAKEYELFLLLLHSMNPSGIPVPSILSLHPLGLCYLKCEQQTGPAHNPLGNSTSLEEDHFLLLTFYW